jgi:hypothetical protein
MTSNTVNNAPKSFTGQGLAHLSGNKRFNPDDIDQNICAAPLRLVVSAVATPVLGLLGTFYYLGAASKSLVQWDKDRAWKHLGSASVDMFRLVTLGVPAALSFTCMPDLYGNNKVEEETTTENNKPALDANNKAEEKTTTEKKMTPTEFELRAIGITALVIIALIPLVMLFFAMTSNRQTDSTILLGTGSAANATAEVTGAAIGALVNAPPVASSAPHSTEAALEPRLPEPLMEQMGLGGV